MEADLAYETLLLLGNEHVAMTRTTWIRLPRKAQQRYELRQAG